MTMQRPSSYLNWTDGDPTKVLQPPANVLLTGWQPGQAPPARYTNWQIWLLDQWIQYLDQLTNTGVPDQAIRLINGGFWSFNATSGALQWDADANLAIASVEDADNTLMAQSVTILDGEVMYVTANMPFNAIGTTVNTVNQITNMNFTGNITVGMAVTGPGIPASTFVTGVGPSGVSLNNNVTSSQTNANFTFCEVDALTPVIADNTNFIPTFNTILIARRVGDVVYLGVNASQMVLLNGEAKELMGSGYVDVYDATAGENLTAGEVVYISQGGSIDPGRTQGRIYKLDASQPYGENRAIFAGMVIKTVLSGAATKVGFSGFFANTGLQTGYPYYADPLNAGGITPTKPVLPDKAVPVGIAISSTILLVSGASGGASDVTQPIFHDEILGYGNGINTNFTLSEVPLDANSVFVFLDSLIVSNDQWSLSGQDVVFGTAPGIAQKVYVQYLLGGQDYLAAVQEVPAGVVNGINTDFLLSSNPTIQTSAFVFLNGMIVSTSEWSLIQSGGTSTVRFNTAPTIGNDVFVAYFIPAGAAYAVNGAQNLGSGHGIFAQVSSKKIQLKSLVAGANIVITETSTEILITAAGGSGGGLTPNGDFNTPNTVVPAVGIVNTNVQREIQWIKGQTGMGAQNISATLQIPVGTIIGQELVLKGIDASDYPVIQGNFGVVVQGVRINGNWSGRLGASISLVWDGVAWDEECRS